MHEEIEAEPEPKEPGATVSAEENDGVIESISEDAAVQELVSSLGDQLGDDETPEESAPTGETKPPAKGKKGKTSASQAAPKGEDEEEPAAPAAPVTEPETPPEPETETLPETPPAETPAETEPAPATAEDTLDLSKWNLPEETAAEIQESFNRALSKKHRKLTREREQREQLEDELGQAREEVQTLKSSVEAKAPRGGVGLGSPFEVEMGNKVAELQQGIAFCDQHEADGWTGPDSKGKEVTYSPEQLRASRRVYERELLKAEIRLEDFQTERGTQAKKFDAAAITEHPWLKNAGDAKTQTIQKTFANFPMLKEIPGMRLLLARALSYKPAGAGATAPPAGGAPANGTAPPAKPAATMKPPPKVTTRPGSAPAAMPSVMAKQDAAWKALEKNPSDQAAVELLKTIVD